MRITILCFVVNLICVLAVKGQKHDSNWLFGYTPFTGFCCGIIDFNTSPPTINKESRPYGFQSYCSVMSDSSGQLIFYSNGQALFNLDHEIMINGDMLNPGFFRDFFPIEEGYASIAGGQSISFPGKSDEYIYIHESLAIDTMPVDTPRYKVVLRPLMYSHISFKNEPLGEVLSKNNVILDEALTYFALCKHGNGRDWWLVVSKDDSNEYFIYLIDPLGVHLYRQQVIGPNSWHDDDEGTGLNLFSPDGKRLARIDTGIGPVLLDFDRCNGVLSGARRVFLRDALFEGGGASFSPNSRFLYMNANNMVFQIDTRNQDTLINPIDTIAIWDLYSSSGNTAFKTSQLMPDGKIYYSSTSNTDVLHVIHRPNLPGKACNLQQHGVSLPAYNLRSIPHFPNYRLGALEGSACDTLNLSN